MGFSFLHWSPIIWCEQMWKSLVVIKMMRMLQVSWSRVGVGSLLSSFGRTTVVFNYLLLANF